jgi:hypothetical protein
MLRLFEHKTEFIFKIVGLCYSCYNMVSPISQCLFFYCRSSLVYQNAGRLFKMQDFSCYLIKYQNNCTVGVANAIDNRHFRREWRHYGI